MRVGWMMSFTLAFICQSHLAYGQDSLRGHHSLVEILSQDGTGLATDARKIFGAPLRFQGREWITTNLAFAGTLLLFTTDASVRTFAQRHHSRFGDDLTTAGEQYGRNLNVLLISGGIYLGGLFLKDESMRTTGRMAIESAVFAGVVTTVFKSLLGRSRPYLNEGAYDFRAMQFSDDRLSLPSGHATLAFALSSVLSNRIDNTMASVGLYSLATLTAVSRVYHDDHWISDTLLGAVIGTSIGCTISSNTHPEEEQATFRISLLPAGIQVALIL